jgi:L-alanine-DL-glutamate epimerase-like enolase superfamily enzyme
MAPVIRLLRADLHYGTGIEVHTATSGPVGALEEIYLVVEHDGELLGCAEIRINIAYLTGLAPARIVEGAVAAIGQIDWQAGPQALIDDMAHGRSDFSSPVCALVDCLLHDWASRAAGQPLADWLGGAFADTWPSNQTLFWCDDAALDGLARDYLARGFCSLKLRVGVKDFASDLRRLTRLREVAGAQVELAVDANGRWSLEEAIANMRAMDPLGIAYVEQPLPAGDWDGLRRLRGATAIPVMLDESLARPSDVEALLSLRDPPGAHLKIVKMGGIAPLLAAARQLTAGGAEVMVGQMNEGALATAAAAHCAMIARPHYAELYGADGLVDDPAAGLTYRDGRVVVPRSPGLGPVLNLDRTSEIFRRSL